ncbi:hypothetical protein ACFY12_21125 [Streptomyces sp. NPDC001339]|uniref:hypothetical protein n=1 Tax=Streptomyces sp. NPDC001339 TaxID=3364563 RepID=UPI0036D007AA
MSDELDLLRAANPVPADGGPWRDGPLDAHAERALNRLLHRTRTRQAGWRLMLRAEAAVLALFAVLAFTLSDVGRDAAAPVTVPEERITRWNADSSGSELTVATDPRHPAPARSSMTTTAADGPSATARTASVRHPNSWAWRSPSPRTSPTSASRQVR